MRRDGRRKAMGALCLGLALQACTSAPPPAPPRAFFSVAPQEVPAVQAFAREQERQIQTCVAARACDRAHYLRGLAALYEDRRVAVKHFRAVSGAPAGPYAESSRAWVRLLEDGRAPAYDPNFGQAAERVVREVLEREAAARTAAGRQEESQALRQQVREQEKRIDELTRQIDALKRVDQEVKERIKPGRSGD